MNMPYHHITLARDHPAVTLPDRPLTILRSSQIRVVFVGKCHIGRVLHLLLVLLHELGVDLYRWGSERDFSDKFLILVSKSTRVDGRKDKLEALTRPGFPVSFLASQRKGFSKL